MAKFYYDFKFACESMGVPAPSSEFFNTPMIALTSLATACAALEGLEASAGDACLLNVAKYCVWLTGNSLGFTPVSSGGTVIVGQGAMMGKNTIQLLSTVQKGVVLRRGLIYIGGCLAAAYFGVLVGAVAYATQQQVARLVNVNAPFDAFADWWYGGYATDARTAEMEKEIARRGGN